MTLNGNHRTGSYRQYKEVETRILATLVLYLEHPDVPQGEFEVLAGQADDLSKGFLVGETYWRSWLPSALKIIDHIRLYKEPPNEEAREKWNDLVELARDRKPPTDFTTTAHRNLGPGPGMMSRFLAFYKDDTTPRP